MDLKAAQLELDMFLAENPQLQPFQMEIDQALGCTNIPEQRIAILKFFINKNMDELNKRTNELQNLVNNLLMELE